MKNTSSATEEHDIVEEGAPINFLLVTRQFWKGFLLVETIHMEGIDPRMQRRKTFLVQPSHVEGYSDT